METENKVEVRENKTNFKRIIKYLICGMLIGLGAVLPGISGGVLCVIFGIYRPLMEFLSSPVKTLKTKAGIIIPTCIGVVIGFLAVAKLLSFLLERYPDQSVCVFVGLIFGMIPSLFKEAGEKGRGAKGYISLFAAFAIMLSLLITLNVISFTVSANFGWYIFCGFCMALSIIVPGMSFSTLLMPLNLYTPLIDGIGNFDFGVLLPAAIGALATIVLFSKAASWLMEKHHCVAFHAIIGIVIAATIVIIPFGVFTAGLTSAIVNGACLIGGAVVSFVFSLADVKKE